jgi:arginine-tRNA-protein transferase
MSDARAGEETVSSPQGDYDALRYVSSETTCPYLPGMQSRSEAYFVERLDGAQYECLLGRGFRRSGRIVYRPRCRACSECRSVRVPVGRFEPTRSMRRVWRRNADLRVEVGEPFPTDEKFELFCDYLDAQHDGTMARTYESFCEFLYDSPIRLEGATHEFRYCLGERLIGVGLADRWRGGLSSVYMYFDPEFSGRSLGTFSVLWEIEYCRREALPYYYVGYYVAGGRKMAYKSRFRPNEVLVGNPPQADWVAFRE